MIEEFHLMNIDQRLIKAISDLNWSKPTDVQQAVIPLVFEKKSIVVQAKTGSGKTAAFAIPVIHEILQEKLLSRDQLTTVLVLAPTKELCSQANRSFKALCKFASKSLFVIDVSQFNDIETVRPLLAEIPDVIIGTPAKVVAHLRAGHFSLMSLKRLIVDEADLVFTFGHQLEVEELKNFLPKSPLQVILMSATLDDTTKVLRRCLVKSGDWVRVELPEEAFLPSDTQLTQYIISAEEEDKYTILIALLKLKLIRGKTLIFSNSVDRCFKLRLFLEEFGIKAALLNSELPVLSRCHAIDQFNRGVFDYLLATDECPTDETTQSDTGGKSRGRKKDAEYGVARGIDFQFVSNVINFDFPLTPSFYVHRVGRTARAGQMGTALSFVSLGEEKLLRAVESLLNPAGEAASLGSTQGSSSKAGSIFRPYQFRLSEVDGFRYRAMDVVRHLTRKVIREARLKEIKLELLNSERLKGYFEDHVPDLEALRHDKPLARQIQPHLRDVPEYLVPAPLRSLMPQTGIGRRRRNRWRRDNLDLVGKETEKPTGKQPTDGKKTQRSGRGHALQVKHKAAKKRKALNPLFSFGHKKSRKK
ncbi:DEAD (Asp-Glu-Ala-Asp) box polypeptide 56 [Fasciolopsis buskii]|uniref:RNA helicase n=1 Tax=Fasciolopsis buskii TaxID=27845 RepID=A0A8E0RX43_9TREM|nr:DEAD (Asp-Glu-Ala-Asp) box polypeptide 56 [Fasciolopsis buski]